MGKRVIVRDGQVIEEEAELRNIAESVDWLQTRLGELRGLAEKPEQVAEWTMPEGAHDAPNIGDHRWHDGQVWRSLIDANTTEPGSDDRWWETTEPPAVPDKLRNPLRELRDSVGPDVQALIDVLTGDDG